MKANDWLFDQGYIKAITRGRRSTENTARLTEAYENGVRFSDWPKTAIETTNGTVEAKSEDLDGEYTLIYPEDVYTAWQFVDGKKVTRSLREACWNCRRSLVQCQCGAPSIVSLDGRGYSPVTIELR